MRKFIFILLLSLFFLLPYVHTQFKKDKEALVYTSDWFSQRVPVWEKYLHEFKGKPNVSYLEVGVFEGRSAFWVLDNILTGKNTKAVLIDPFFAEYEKIFLKNLNTHPKKDKIKVIKDFSEKALRRLPQSHFDIIYIDGSHAAKSVYIDAAFSWGLLKEGGVLIFDDLPWKKGELPVTWRPEVSIEAFLTAFGEDIKVLHKDWQVFIKKRKIPKGQKYSRVGSCLFYWRGFELFNKFGEPIKLEQSVTERLKKKLLNREYGRLTSSFEGFKDFKKLSSCDIE